MSATYEFSLPGISCINCVSPLESALLSCKEYNIDWFKIDIPTKTLRISIKDHRIPLEEVKQYFIQFMDEFGIEGLAINSTHPSKEDIKKETPFFLSHTFQGILGTFLGVALLILSLVASTLPLSLLITIGVISTSLTFILGAESYYHAIIKLVKTRTLTMDTLFTISTLTVISVSLAAFFIPWLPMMFEAGLLIFGFRHIGLAIEESLKQKMTLNKKFQHLLPVKVRMITALQRNEECLLANIEIDDILLIYPGEIIPVDGVVLSDESFIYDTIKTGASLPRPLKKGEYLISGMRLAENVVPIQLKVSAKAKSSYLARLDKSIEQAHLEKAPIEDAASRLLQYFIPAVLGLAVLSGACIAVFFPIAIAIQCAISVLVSACPCTLGLVVPLAVKIGIHKAALHGVQFKSAKTLQAADAVDTVIFDLNGTLTTGVPSISRYGVFNNQMDAQQLLAYAAKIEEQCSHAVAKAICDKAGTLNLQSIVLPKSVVIDNSNHSGVRAQLDDTETWIIGNEDFLREGGIELQINDKPLLNPGESVVYAARDKKLLGYFVVRDPLRNDAKLVINALKDMGKQVHICTGADLATANHYAGLLGIPLKNVAASCVGMELENNEQSKTAYIKKLKSLGLTVAMVGDAANDSLAIAKSDFGIALKSHSASEITQQQAGAIIESDSLQPVANAFAVAQQTVKNIKQNLVFSLSYNLLAVVTAGGALLSMGVMLNPGVGVALMILQTTLVLLNAYHFKEKALPSTAAPSLENKAVTTHSYNYVTDSLILEKTSLNNSYSPNFEKEDVEEFITIPSQLLENTILIDDNNFRSDVERKCI